MTFQLPSKLPQTIPECHALINDLYQIIQGILKRTETLEQENRWLKEQLSLNSSNSSLPPSRDLKKKRTRVKNTNRGGAKVGHQGHHRQLLPVEQVDQVIYCSLSPECACGGVWRKKPEPVRHQVYELPPLRLNVTEYQLEKGTCSQCGINHVASLPTGITFGITGPRLTGFMMHLVARYHLSRRQVQGFLQEQFSFKLSLGCIFNKQTLVNATLAPQATKLLPLLRQEPVVYIDETSHNRDGTRQWLWGLMSNRYAYFHIDPSRGKKVLKQLLEDHRPIVVSDRHMAYRLFNSDSRQLCWAHLKRDFTRLAEKKDTVIARIGRALLACHKQLFEYWYAFKTGELPRFLLQQQIKPLRQQTGELLEQATYTDPVLKASRRCQNMLHDFGALWSFIDHEGVEPTNNHAERGLRPAVLWRKHYFNTRSDEGSSFVANSLSLLTTARLQGNNPWLSWLEQVTTAFYPPAASLDSS